MVVMSSTAVVAASSRPVDVTDPVITVRGLTKSYGGRTVVDHLDLDVHAGEVVGLIGANGAGKTTTVEILQGLRRADAGQVRVLGLDPVAAGDRLRRLVGSQLQSSGLPDRMRVGEAMRLFAGPNASDAEVLLERFGLAGKRRSPYGGMSGGERQRLFLVLAVLNRPRLVILDELTQGLDPAARHEVWSAVEQLRSAGTTVLLVTHELEEAEALCEHVVAMRDGRVLDRGAPAELIARHAGAAVVRFTLPAQDAATVASMLQELNRLPGVAGVVREHGQAVVRGSATAIAHVGSWLVRTGCPVPDDLRVDVPSLESALLTLLESPASSSTPASAPRPRLHTDTIGATS